jgi:hypothetical protein
MKNIDLALVLFCGFFIGSCSSDIVQEKKIEERSHSTTLQFIKVENINKVMMSAVSGDPVAAIALANHFGASGEREKATFWVQVSIENGGTHSSYAMLANKLYRRNDHCSLLRALYMIDAQMSFDRERITSSKVVNFDTGITEDYLLFRKEIERKLESSTSRECAGNWSYELERVR